MDILFSFVLLAIVLAVVGVGLLLFLFYGGSDSTRNTQMQVLLGSKLPAKRDEEAGLGQGKSEVDVEWIKKTTARTSRSGKGKKTGLASRLFQAGIYVQRERDRFRILQICSLLLSPLVIGATAYFFMPNNLLMILICLALGFVVGVALPDAYLSRAIEKRHEEVMYFLPLVVEQISIGVSSALDIGPCVSQVVQMAGDRDCHNPVTEMLVHVERLMHSGLNLEDSLLEVGVASGQSEVKHAFMFLAQCAKHGGEISRQLQELSDAIMIQKQVLTEARIAKLPVMATLPLAMVFAGFFLILLSGLGARVFEGLNGINV